MLTEPSYTPRSHAGITSNVSSVFCANAVTFAAVLLLSIRVVDEEILHVSACKFRSVNTSRSAMVASLNVLLLLRFVQGRLLRVSWDLLICGNVFCLKACLSLRLHILTSNTV